MSGGGSRESQSRSQSREQMSGMRDQLAIVPICTTGLIAVNVLVHVVVFITSTNAGVLAISAYEVIYMHQVGVFLF